MFELTNRIIVVTGAGSGIGKATLAALAKQGAAVVAADKRFPAAADAADAVVAAGGVAHAYELDVAHEESWNQLVSSLKREFGRLDGLVNCAGILLPKTFLETSVHELERTFDVNVKGTFLGCRTSSALMIESRKNFGAKPSIVNVSSTYGMFAGPAHVAYAASKGAIRMMSKGMAWELAKHGIRVNTVFPGPSDTPLLRDNIEMLADMTIRRRGEDGLADLAKTFPMGRIGEAADVAGAIVFLCSDAAGFMTGGELLVDGGQTLM